MPLPLISRAKELADAAKDVGDGLPKPVFAKNAGGRVGAAPNGPRFT